MNAKEFMRNLKSKCRIQILCICCPGGRAEIGNDSDTEDTPLSGQTTPREKDLLLNVN